MEGMLLLSVGFWQLNYISRLQVCRAGLGSAVRSGVTAATGQPAEKGRNNAAEGHKAGVWQDESQKNQKPNQHKTISSRQKARERKRGTSGGEKRWPRVASVLKWEIAFAGTLPLDRVAAVAAIIIKTDLAQNRNDKWNTGRLYLQGSHPFTVEGNRGK